MTGVLFALNETVENGSSATAAKDEIKKFSKRNAASRPQEVGDSSDRNLAKDVSQAIAQLQDAMDEASRAGLIIEPTFKSISGRFNEFGVSVDSYICSVEVYRKLS